MVKGDLISIILPVYDGEEFFELALNSVIHQTYQNWELIIVNDCSTDATEEIAKNYKKIDNRIFYIKNDRNLKLPASLNIGHRVAKGRYITWTSDDNILKEDMLEILVQHLTASGSDLVFSDYDVIETNGKFRRTHHFGPVSSLLFGNHIGASFLYKRELFFFIDGYDEDLHTLEDYDFWLRAAINFRFHHVKESLYEYRIHRRNLTSKINDSPELKNSFLIKHQIVFKKLSKSLGWSRDTEDFLLMVRGFSNWDWIFFKSNFEDIVKDFKKFQNAIESNDKRNILQGMDLKLRGRILNNSPKKSILRWLLFKRPEVFFGFNYSKKNNLKITRKLF